MRTLARLMVVIEVFVCFGPLLLLLLLGLLLVPFWLMGITTQLASPWDFFYPLFLILFGMLGVVALISIVLEITWGKQWFSARLRKGLFVPGLIGVLMFNWPWLPTLLAGEMTVDAIWPLLIYFLLPVASSIHLLWLASRRGLATKR